MIQMRPNSRELLGALKALSDETRVRILHILSHGALHVNEIVQIFRMGQSRISRHLKILLDAGILESQREGTWVYYRYATESNVHYFAKDLAQVILQYSAYLPHKDSDEKKVKELLNSRREKSQTFFNRLTGNMEQIQEQVLSPSVYKPYLLSMLPKKTGLILDLGCGPGRLISDFAKRAGKVIGVDASPQMLELARKNFANNKNIKFLESALESLPYSKSDADVVIASMVLHHISNPLLVLKEAHRILKNGGSLCIVDLLKHDKEFMREEYADLWLGFEPQILQNWLESTGFQLQSIREIPTETEFKIITIKAKKKGGRNVR